MSKLNISSNTIGISGEFYMAYILAKHNFQVNMSLGRTAGFDLFVQSPKGKNLTVSVKTTYLKINKFLWINKKVETLVNETLFYAFVRLNMPDDVPEFWIVPSKIVAPVVKESYKILMATPKRDGSARKDISQREFYLIQRPNFPDDWEEQLKGFKGNIDLLK